jgi:hypothetical protein
MARTIKNRKPIDIKLIINENETVNVLKDSLEFRNFVFEHVYNAIKDAIKNKLGEAKVLNVVNLNYSLNINKSQFINALKNILNFHEEQENYLKCKEINKLIKKYEKL